MTERTCAACGVSIEHRHPKAASCSIACYSWARKHPGEPRPSRVCPACGKSIVHMPTQAKSCNPNCGRWARLYPGVPKPETHTRSPETTARILASRSGYRPSAETRAKISASVSEMLRGRQVSDETRAKIAAAQSGTQGHQWVGDEVGYGGAHKRHRSELPMRCEHCGTTDGLLDAALRQDAPKENLVRCEKRRLVYSPHTEDYMRLCRTCHAAYDKGSRCRGTEAMGPLGLSRLLDLK